jgi:hypothetical protein
MSNQPIWDLLTKFTELMPQKVRKNQDVLKKIAANVIVGIFSAIFAELVLVLLPKFILYGSLLRKLKDGLLRHPAIIALFLAIIAIALGLLTSLWKRKAQGSYGMAEIVFGALLSYNAALHLAPNFEFAKLFAVGTAIYVIARGFNNILDGPLLNIWPFVIPRPNVS